MIYNGFFLTEVHHSHPVGTEYERPSGFYSNRKPILIMIHMLNLTRLIIVIVLFVGCANSEKVIDAIVFKPHIKQYIDIYMADNDKLSSETNIIIIQCEISGENDFILNIISEIPVNTQNSFVEAKDSIYFGYYKDFRVFMIDNHHKLLKSKYNSIVSLKDSCLDEIVPISYNGAFWSLIISEGKLVDFSYQYCKPDTEVTERLQSITIPPDWNRVLND